MLPKSSKKVFSGLIFDVFQWPQKMFDGSTATFERVIRQNTVVIIPIIDGKVVTVKQKQPGTDWYYDLPSGRMDKKGESPKNAALRELLEETGLKPKSLKLWKTYSPSGKVMQKVYFFIAQDCVKVAEQKLDPGEKIVPAYKTFQQFLELSDNPRCFFGPLMIDVLLARIHKENRQYLEKSFFGTWQTPPKMPKRGPKSNW
ncbi:MAG: NUDIX hydrolase [Candidatus Doudnabacteria bacterium]|jgi:8-oxo-dGTP pyrophosphatase MutT (NUDIX family)